MTDTVKIQLQGSILNSLAQKTTSTPVSAPVNNMPNSVLSQNINSGNNNTSNSFDGSKVTSALATISNKIEKGFMQTVSVITNMQVALTSRLETINRQLQKLNELMTFLHDTQIKQMKQRTEGTIGLRLTEMFDNKLFKTMIKFREQLIEPLSKEAINVAISRLVMGNPELRKFFGFKTQEYQKRQRSANFTYELYQTILNIPTFLNNVGSDMINYFAKHHKDERSHWRATEKYLQELVACCIVQNKNTPGFRNSYKIKKKDINDKLTARFDSMDKSMKQMSLYNKESKKYELKSINIFEKLLEKTITVSDSLFLISTKILLNPRGIIFKILKTFMAAGFFTKIIRSVLSQLPENILSGAENIGIRVESFFKTNLTKIFSKVLPDSIKEGFLSTSKAIWSTMKNMGTMMFSTDEKKREEARSIFMNQLKAVLNQIFIKFVLPITRAVLGLMSLRFAFQWYIGYLRRQQAKGLVEDATGKMVVKPGRNLKERMKGMMRGHSVVTMPEAMNVNQYALAGMKRGVKGTGRFLNTRAQKAYNYMTDPFGGSRLQRGSNYLYDEYTTGKAALANTGRAALANTKRTWGNITTPIVNRYQQAGVTGVAGSALKGVVAGLVKSPLILKSMAGTVVSLFSGISKLLLTGGGIIGAIFTFIIPAIKALISNYKSSGHDSVDGFIGSIFDIIIAYITQGVSWLLTKGPGFIWEVMIAVGKGFVKILGSIMENAWFMIQMGFYKLMDYIPGLDYTEEINELNKQIAERSKGALEVIEENEKRKAKAEINENNKEKLKEKETNTQQSIMEIVDRIKQYFVGGEFTAHLTKTAEMMGSGLAQIAGIISDGLSNLGDATSGIFGNFAQVAGGFLKGLVGETDATGILDTAIKYANEQGWSGAASILGRSRESVLGNMAQTAGAQAKAADVQTEAAKTQLQASSMNAETAKLNAEIAKKHAEILGLSEKASVKLTTALGELPKMYHPDGSLNYEYIAQKAEEDKQVNKLIKDADKSIKEALKNPHLSSTRSQNYIPPIIIASQNINDMSIGEQIAHLTSLSKSSNKAKENTTPKIYIMENYGKGVTGASGYIKLKEFKVGHKAPGFEKLDRNGLTWNVSKLGIRNTDSGGTNKNGSGSIKLSAGNFSSKHVDTDMNDPMMSIARRLNFSSLLDSNIEDVYFGQKEKQKTTIGVSNSKDRNAFFGLPSYARQTSSYKEVRKTANGGTRYHWGLDFGGMRVGTPIVAPKRGKVLVAGWFGGYGHSMAVHYPELHTILKYAHLDSINVRSGSIVEPGTIIGTVGKSGGNYLPHLHLEAIRETTPPSQIYQKNKYSDITMDPNNLYNEYKMGMKTGIFGRSTAFLSNIFNPTPPESLGRPSQVQAHILGGNNTSKETSTNPIILNYYDTNNTNNVSSSNTSENNIPADANLLALFMLGVGF